MLYSGHKEKFPPIRHLPGYLLINNYCVLLLDIHREITCVAINFHTHCCTSSFFSLCVTFFYTSLYRFLKELYWGISGPQEERFIWCEPRERIYLLRWTPHGQLRAQILQMVRAYGPSAGSGFLHTLYTRKNFWLNALLIYAVGVNCYKGVPSFAFQLGFPQPIRTAWLGPIRTMHIWVPHLHKMDLIRNLFGGGLSL